MKVEIKSCFVQGLIWGCAVAAWGVDNPLSVVLEGAIVRQGGAYYGMGAQTNGPVWVSDNLFDWRASPERFPFLKKKRPRKPLLEGRLGMWDSLDGDALATSEWMGYRGTSYLLYAANYPGPRTGLRAIGVARNEKPSRVADSDKRPDPVFRRNTERLARAYAVLLPSGEYVAWRGRYTTTTPPVKEWMKSDMKWSGWRIGEGGFGFPLETGGAQIQSGRTKWTTQQIWVRREFDVQGKPETPVLTLRHEGAVQVFLNGKMVFESEEPSVSYSYFDISEAAAGAFRPEDNVLAVHAVVPKNAEYRFLDFGLFDAGDQPVEPTVYGVDAPCIVTGPNGFEKWMAYRAWWNGTLGSGIDRLFFYDDELVVDGPTTASTPGYHPPPARPTFSGSLQNSNHWNRVGNKAYLKTAPATHYLFEANLRFPGAGKGSVGVVAWSDGKKDLIVSVNPSARTWECHVEPGLSVSKRFRLPSGFQDLGKRDARLRITKNGGHFKVMLDEVDLTSTKPIKTPLTGSGVPGLLGGAGDDVVYTVGWDEHDASITGWGAAADGTPGGGEWRHPKDRGFEQRKHSTPGRIFKGDLLDQYEFTVNARTKEFEEGEKRQYGVFPVFADRNNYLQAMIDPRRRQLVVSGKRGGKAIGPFTQSLQCRIPVHPFYDKNMDYKNQAAWVYGLRSPSVISGLDIRWMEGTFDHLQQSFCAPSEEMVIGYALRQPGREPILWDDGYLYVADEPKPRVPASGIFNPISIRPMVANYISLGFYSSSAMDSKTRRFIRRYVPGASFVLGEELSVAFLADDVEARPQEVLVVVEAESSYFFRCVKLKNRVIIELNGRPMLEVEGEWPPSHVGLVTEGQPCFYNGITLMHLPGE